MKRLSLRSWLLTAAIIVIAIVAWVFLAPSNIGGSTRYVVTSGVSMEPRFHTGDLALVRPTDSYAVGEIVAYRSTLLHTIVLHRIVAIHGDHYVFKGDNNDFIDPVSPTRSELLGKLWLHIPRGGVLLKWLHEPLVAAGLCAIVGLLLLVSVTENRRRRKRRRKGASGFGRQGLGPVNTRDQGSRHSVNFGRLLTASLIAVAVFAVLGLLAFSRSADKPSAVTSRYTQQVTFGYHASAPKGPVYPTGVVNTGDPIFLTLVHNVAISIKYALETGAPHTVGGTEDILLELTGPGGWTRTIVLTPPTHFTGDHTHTAVTLDVPSLQAILSKVDQLTGTPTGGQFTIQIVPEVHIAGTVADRRVNTTFAPAMGFQLQTLQLVPTGASATASSGSASPVGASSSSPGNYISNQNGTVSTPTTAPNTFSALGVTPEVGTLRWIAILGLLLSGALALYAFLRKRAEPFDESVNIQSQYGHLIVPIVGGEDLGWPPVDVPNIRALVRLAESGQRLILNNRSGGVDTYMVNDEGTVYRYQVKSSKVVWGEWTDDPIPVQQAEAA